MGIVRSAANLARRLIQMDSLAAQGARHDHEAVYLRLLQRLREVHGADLKGLTVLDFGCGYRCTLLGLLAGDVRGIVGLEVSTVVRDGWLRTVEEDGGWWNPAALATQTLEYLTAVRYHGHMKRRVPNLPDPGSYRIVRYDGKNLPFEDGAFECIISNAVLQYLPEPLEHYAAEMVRVLKPGGRIDLEWHNFYSWRGHHLPEQESRRDPWGHLQGGAADPTLNRVTPDRMVEAFSPYFEELELLPHDRRHRIAGRNPDYQPEAEEYLTAALQRRLDRYPVEWLTTRGYFLRGRVKETTSSASRTSRSAPLVDVGGDHREVVSPLGSYL